MAGVPWSIERQEQWRKDWTKRFWRYVLPTPSGCWEWQGAKYVNSKFKYGKFMRGRKHLLAHRVMYETAVGEIPEGMYVMHICDNPSCVNPIHLTIGTSADNSLDSCQKGRRSRKLNAKKVKEIRVALDNGVTPTEVANDCGLGLSTVRQIRDRIIWKHLA